MAEEFATEKQDTPSQEILDEIAENQRQYAADRNAAPSSINDLYSLGFSTPDAIRQIYDDTYTPEWLSETHKGDKIEQLYNQGTEKQKQDLLFLAAFDEETRETGLYPQTETANIRRIDKGKDDRLRLIMRNLGGTGLDFSIEADGRSIVFAKGQQFTAAQVKELARFFYMHGIGEQGLADFKLPDKIKEAIVSGADGESQTFGDVFAQNLKEIGGKDGDLKLFGNENLAGNENTPTSNADTYHGSSTSRGNSGLTLSYKKAKGKIIARMGIMNFSSDRITTRRCADGSMVICAYNSEIDMRHDSENSKGDIKRTKAFAVKFNIVNGVPVVSPYVPVGKPMETKHAQCMLEALKSQGCTHFEVPNAVVYSGAGMGAVWQACGKTMMVPIVDPPRLEFSADNINDMLKTVHDEGKQDRKLEDQWKANLIEQLHDQEDITAYMKAHNTKEKPSYEALDAWVAENGHAPARNSKIGDMISKLEGDLKYTKLMEFTDGMFKQHILQVSKGKDENGTQVAEKWDAVQYMAATYAYAEMLTHYRKNDQPNLSEFLPDQPDRLIAFFTKRAQDPEVHKAIANDLQQNIANGMREADALRNVRDEAKSAMDLAISTIQTDYGDFKPFDKFPYNLGTYNQANYFGRKVDENGQEVTERGKPVYDINRPLSGGRSAPLTMQQLTSRRQNTL